MRPLTPHPDRPDADRRRAPVPWRPEAWAGTVVRLAGTEALGGVVLTVAVVAARAWANLAPHPSYERFWDAQIRWVPLPGDLLGTVRELVDNGLMTVFFLAVGLEVGRERASGSLRDNRHALLPVVAALGGMIGAALTYVATVALTGGGPAVFRGWGVPMATDVAFTLGAMALLGRRVPSALRVFVLALAVADDVGSVVVLAVVSSSHVRPWPLVGALGGLAAVAMLRRRSTAWWPYVAAVVTVWLLLAWAGIEPTLAGAFVGMLVPCGVLGHRRRARTDGVGPSERLEAVMNPLSILVVLPVFVLGNAGVVLNQHLFGEPDARSVVFAVVAARLVGKLAGITLAVLLLVRLGFTRLPDGVRWRHLSGAAALCGMGFTVPLLFAATSFAGHPLLVGAAQVGLLTSTAVAFAVGASVLAVAGRRDGTPNRASGAGPHPSWRRDGRRRADDGTE
jgi:NhaA family Na+:H+ antiporter